MKKNTVLTTTHGVGACEYRLTPNGRVQQIYFNNITDRRTVSVSTSVKNIATALASRVNEDGERLVKANGHGYRATYGISLENRELTIGCTTFDRTSTRTILRAAGVYKTPAKRTAAVAR